MTPKEQQQLKRENEHLASELRKAQRVREQLEQELEETKREADETLVELENATGFRTAVTDALERQDKLVELITMLVQRS